MIQYYRRVYISKKKKKVEASLKFIHLPTYGIDFKLRTESHGFIDWIATWVISG